MTSPNGIITVCAYRKTTFFAYFAKSHDEHTCTELPPELVRLMQTSVVCPVLFTGDVDHDSRVWVWMKGGDDFKTFIADTHHYGHPVIVLMPEDAFTRHRTAFSKFEIALNEYGMKNRMTDKFCHLGLSSEKKGVGCTVIADALCCN